MLYRLIVLTGPLKNQRITVDQEPMTLGRDESCQIVLPDDEVTARHAVLEHRPESGLHIRDLGTMHRLIVNGRELRESRLKHGDMVEIGRTRFLVQAVVAADVSASDADPDERTNPKLVLLVALVAVMAFVTWQRWPQTHPAPAIPEAEPEPAAVVIEPESSPSNLPPQIVEQTQTSAVVVATETNVLPVAVIATSVPPRVVNVATTVPPVALVSTSALPINNTTTQVTAEIQQIREDLLAMRQSMRDLTRPPAVVTAAPPAVASAPSNAVVAAATNFTPAATNPVAAAGPVGRVMRVLNVEQMRFPASEDFDEMRTFNIALNLTNPRVTVVNDEVQIAMTFYDEDQKDGTVKPSQDVEPLRDLRPSQPWGADRRSVANATFMLPKGAREKARAAGHDMHYCGFVVRVLYRGEFQDEWAVPRTLLTQAQTSNAVVNTTQQKPER